MTVRTKKAGFCSPCCSELTTAPSSIHIPPSYLIAESAGSRCLLCLEDFDDEHESSSMHGWIS